MAHSHRTRRGTAHPKFQAVGLPAAALIAVNVLLMYAVALTPIAYLASLAFRTPIVGLLVFGGALTAGNYLADRGLKNEGMGLAFAGTAILEVTYGVLGGGILAMIASGSRVLALAVTLVVTVAMTVGIAAYVYLRGGDYSHCLFIFAGFTLRLGYEIWRVRADYAPDRSLVHALGIYVAFTGVFIHVLQIVVRLLGRR
ncbi:hypothetical protein BRC75_02850 [Halobacteriales archaeon QH_7_69_31]|nr:MAG: hypothetical protein BRC75_02850 [Halobacteriales archaeon QH_7_69_31]